MTAREKTGSLPDSRVGSTRAGQAMPSVVFAIACLSAIGCSGQVAAGTNGTSSDSGPETSLHAGEDASADEVAKDETTIAGDGPTEASDGEPPEADAEAGLCGEEKCPYPFMCCSGHCIDPRNDPDHCGACEIVCASDPGHLRYCHKSACSAPACADAAAAGCDGGAACCGEACCATGEYCCDAWWGMSLMFTSCSAPTTLAPTCPRGCLACE